MPPFGGNTTGMVIASSILAPVTCLNMVLGLFRVWHRSKLQYLMPVEGVRKSGASYTSIGA